MKSSIEFKQEFAESETRQAHLKEKIARLEDELSVAKKQLFELEGTPFRPGKIAELSHKIVEAENREKQLKKPLAKWSNAEDESCIFVSKVTAKRVYLTGYVNGSLRDEIAFSRETGKAVHYCPNWMRSELTLDVPTTLKAWEEYIAGGADT